jgi:dephospho-CoA kinase
MNPSEAQRRVGLQMPNDEKLRYATATIDCSGSLDETSRQVQVFLAKLKQTASGSPTR